MNENNSSSANQCPYCFSALDQTAVPCPGCNAQHHAVCYAENLGCAVLGCTSKVESAPEVSAETSVLATAQEGSVATVTRTTDSVAATHSPVAAGAAAEGEVPHLSPTSEYANVPGQPESTPVWKKPKALIVGGAVGVMAVAGVAVQSSP